MNIAHIASKKDYFHYELANQNSKGKWELNHINIIDFYVNRGYFIYRTSIDKHVFIRIIDNIVKVVGKKDLKDEILRVVEDEGNRPYHEFILKSIRNVTADELLETLPAKQVDFKKDTKSAMQLYYKNCIVKITKEDIKTFSYDQLNGYIWESQIIQRNFDDKAIAGSDFKNLCENISNKDPERFKSIISSLGFIIHNYKSPGYCPAVIFNDEVISPNPDGGTGKGILIKGLQRMIKVLSIDGKTFTFDKNFIYQRVTADTRLICFQDVNKNFDFERCFSILTEGIVTEKKGKDELFISFEDSPKVGITTNYAIRGSGNSNERRRNELEISQYYNGDFTPFDDFGRFLFDDWEDHDWLSFDRFMAECCQFYLINGIVKQSLINLPEKKLIAETNTDFLEFLEDRQHQLQGEISKSLFYESFLAEYPAYHKVTWMTKNLFTKWLVTYCDFQGIKIDTKARDTSGNVRVYRFS